MPLEDDQPVDWDDLVRRVKDGDQAAASEMVDSLYPHVIKIVRSHLPRGLDEEDLAQEIFMKVFTKIDQFLGKQPFDHWVARIALNTCYDRLRAKKVRPELRYADLSEKQVQHIEGTAQAVEASDSTNSAKETVDKLLETLNPREQIVIRLIDLEEKSIAEASQLTGWGESKVKVTAHRARKKLEKTLHRLRNKL